MNPPINTSVKINQPLSLKEASLYLASNMADNKSASHWKKYLEENVLGRCTKYGGYKLKCEVIDGHPHYSETTLKVFIKITGSGVDRRNVTQHLNQVDKKSIKNERKRYKIKGTSKLSRNSQSNSFL